MKKLVAASLLGALVSLSAAGAADPQESRPERIPGLKAAAQITQDREGIYHVRANNEEDAFFLQGWVHARDRLFQMDQNRRLASGTLAELLGPGALASDVQLRTIGLRRAAERSWAALSPQTRAAISAYTRGVNAWIASSAPPPEYGALELTRVAPWTEVDSVVVGKLIAFGLSFDLDIDPTVAFQSYVAAGEALGFDGAVLYSEDLNRSAPFDPAATVPDASVAAGRPGRAHGRGEARGWDGRVRPEALEAAKAYREKLKDIPIFQRILDKNRRDGSNLWAVSGRHTASGRPLIANDPHLQLGTPSTFYPMGIEVSGRFQVFGSGFPGVPGIVQGYNRHISWGTTNNAIDVTDTYQEQLVPDPTSPSGFSSLYQKQLEHVIPIPEVFRANQPGNDVTDDVVAVPPGGDIPPATLIVPRRNNGPIVNLNSITGVALSVQYTGFSPTRELDTFLMIDRATNLEEFVAALQFLDFGSQNFVYGDDRGNIAYFTTGEMPVREDLQAGTVGAPWFIRSGQGGNEWLPVQHRQPNQAVEYEVLTFSEMPQIVNPPAGWFVNANNDPAGITLDNNPLNQLRPGGGIYYLAYAWDRGFRAGRINSRINEILSSGRRISFEDMQSIQADVKLRDAEYFTPWIAGALERAKAASAGSPLAVLAADASVVEAVDRLANWDFSTPTGIVEGWDAGKPAGTVPGDEEARNSVAATLYAVWRSRFVANTVDAALVPLGLPLPGSQEVLTALRSVLDNFEARDGKGASGVDFFNVPGVTDPSDQRDIVILASLKEALTRLASDEFEKAFDKSTNQDDYRWGRLHRIVFAHPLDGPFSIPPAGGAFPPPLFPLSGIPTDGGFQTVDASSHSVRGAGTDGFMFNAGPVRRFVSEPRRGGARSESIWPGGTSGVLGSPFYAQFLTRWLSNDAIPLLLGQGEVRSNAARIERFVPAR